MANKDYTFDQVVNGTGYFSKSQDNGYSAGVKTLQDYLGEIGYTITDNEGRFGDSTENAVEDFQYELALGQDGSAGPDTCLRLNAVHSSMYDKTFGHPLETNQWGNNVIDNYINTTQIIDAVIRVIYAEGGRDNTEDAKGIALVLRNRYDNGADDWKAVLTSGYSTTSASNENARKPRRGYGGYAAQGYVSPAWKNAVDLTIAIHSHAEVSYTGYIITGITPGSNPQISSSRKTITSHDNKNSINQKAFYAFESDVSEGDVDTAVTPLTATRDESCNVIYRMQ